MNELLELLALKMQGDAPLYVLAAALAALTTAVAGWPAQRLAHRLGAIDVPRGRHQHRRPTPRFGGVAVWLGLALGTALGLAGLWLHHPECCESLPRLAAVVGVAGLVCLLGMRDDVRELSPGHKLLGLGAAGVMLVLVGVRIEFLDLPLLGKLPLGPFAALATVVWVLACTNAVNLIDGVDGLGSGTSAVASMALALVAHGMGDPATAIALMAVAGACGGFLLHNREPARQFLGDSGSLQLGFLFAALAANGSTKRATAVLLTAGGLALAVPLLDSTQAFVRRFRRAAQRLGRGHWLQKLRATAVGDREHIHHRLLGHGLSPRRVARTLSLCAVVPGLSALLLLPSNHPTSLWCAAAGLGSALVLWRLFRTKAGPSERTLTLPATPPRSLPHPAPGRPVVLEPTPRSPVEAREPAAVVAPDRS
jgi:UDP-GlcNAc:undecaprenyl-phosphate GlcNAc-1-phosphate transferase